MWISSVQCDSYCSYLCEYLDSISDKSKKGWMTAHTVCKLYVNYTPNKSVTKSTKQHLLPYMTGVGEAMLATVNPGSGQALLIAPHTYSSSLEDAKSLHLKALLQHPHILKFPSYSGSGSGWWTQEEAQIQREGNDLHSSVWIHLNQFQWLGLKPFKPSSVTAPELI